MTGQEDPSLEYEYEDGESEENPNATSTFKPTLLTGHETRSGVVTSDEGVLVFWIIITVALAFMTAVVLALYFLWIRSLKLRRNGGGRTDNNSDRTYSYSQDLLVVERERRNVSSVPPSASGRRGRSRKSKLKGSRKSR